MTVRASTILGRLLSQLQGTVVACALSVSAASFGQGVADGALANDADGGQWQAYGRTFSETHDSPLEQINTSNVSTLSLAWYHDLDTGQRTDSQPLEADGIVYVATGQSVVRALDGASGKLLWRFDPQVGKVAGVRLRASWGIRGLAFGAGHIYVGTTDGRLISLDAKTGALAWTMLTVDERSESTITGAPLFFRGKVLIGFAGGDRSDARGAVNCFDAATGRHLWRFYTVPTDPKKDPSASHAMKMAAKTWSGEWWKFGGGGVVWNAMTFDPKFNRVYIGTGNADVWNPSVRNPQGKDNLFTSSLVALDADTGKYVWHYQETPNDGWDYDSDFDIELATLTLDGRRRDVILHAPKNGFFYVIDRADGKLISAEKIDKVSWASKIDIDTGRPVEAPGIRYADQPVLMWPSVFGTHNFPPMSYDARDHLVFIPVIHMAMVYDGRGVNPKKWLPAPNTWTTALSSEAPLDTVRAPSEEFGSSLLAWDPVNQREVWRIPTAGTWGGGTMSTAGGLVFQGQLDGTFNAFSIRDGKKLWTFPAGVAPIGAPITYTSAGRQYVTVLTGPIGGTMAAAAQNTVFGSNYRDPRRVLTFALGGTAMLPAKVAVDSAPVVTAEPLDVAASERGAALYGVHCQHCHGIALVSAGSAPDLRASALVQSMATFKSVVQEGLLVSRGMPKYGELTAADVAALRAYIRSGAAAESKN